jgi:hypothetical protein
MKQVSIRGTQAVVGWTLSSGGIAPMAINTSEVEIPAGPVGKFFPTTVVIAR